MSSRCSFELVQKSAVLGVSTLVTLSRATSMASELAARCRINLITCIGDDGLIFHHRASADSHRSTDRGY